ncbi:MAG: nuclear transport factor 2 family protein [Saprospiraceae bacterium]|nr:nuclear transport factor 2 family protein [Pyrinomonadaceae bacterium]
MNNKLITLLILTFCMSCIGGSLFAQEKGKTDEDILRVLKEYDNAWNKKDVDGVARIFATNYIYFDSLGGAPRSGQPTLDFLKSPDYKLTFVERSEIKTFRTGDTIIVSSRWIGKGSWKGGNIDDDQRCGLVFAKENNAWKLIAEHCTQIVSK